MAWPGNGNPDFWVDSLPKTEHGWAPFYDYDSDGIYDPKNGDFPIHASGNVMPNRFPKELTWTVFNDATPHYYSNSPLPLNVEVQQTTWTLDCESQPEIENTVFVNYKLINRGLEPIDSFFVGVVVLAVVVGGAVW